MPWYNLCAICMVLDAPNPHFPEAICCIVEVVRGGAGFLLKTCDVISETKYSLELIFVVASLTASLLRKVNFSTLLPL